MRDAAAGAFFALHLFACSSTDATTLDLVTGAETDTFTKAPAPTLLRVDETAYTGDGGTQTSTLATIALPASTLDLGTVDEGTTGVLTVWGLDDAGAVVVFGSTPPVSFQDIAGGTLPIFVQRTGEFARLPSPPADSRQAPTLTVIEDRYLFIGAGSGVVLPSDAGADASTGETCQLYDLLTLAASGAPPTLPRTPASIVLDGTVAWLIDADGGTYFDFSDSYLGDISLPSGSSFAEVAGGATIVGDDGASYVVGATRGTGDPSAAVLKIDPNDTSNSNYSYGNPSRSALTTPRLGAAATWANGRGLVVVGGSATAAGVEVLPSGAGLGQALPYPADDSTGAAAAMLDDTHVLIAGGMTPQGGDPGVRVVDLGCSAASCAASAWPGLPTAIMSAQLFVNSSGANAVVVGSEPGTGLTHAFSLSSTTVSELPTKIAHVNARATVSPTGTILLAGGADGGEIESYTP